MRQLRSLSRRTPEEPRRSTSPDVIWGADTSLAPMEWELRGVGESKHEWLDHGLGPRDARLAASCRNAGLLPSDLGLTVAGATVLDRITRGEPPREVARLVNQQRQGDRRTG